jgi:prepilin-type N-terminal cleavage/methylation domain-containing protein
MNRIKQSTKSQYRNPKQATNQKLEIRNKRSLFGISDLLFRICLGFRASYLGFEVHPRRNRGFTLIELLVVISIIALLSTIVFGAIGDARKKAQNKKQNETARQYINALELYRNEDNGIYPKPSPMDITFHCLGYESGDGNCDGSRTGNGPLNTAVGDFIPGPPKGNEFSVANGTKTGYLYRCVDSICDSYQLLWFLNGPSASCIGGGIKIPAGSDFGCIFDKINN